MRYTRTWRYGIDLYVFQLHFVQLVGQFYDAFIFHLEGGKKIGLGLCRKSMRKKSRKARVVFHNHMRPKQQINVPFTQNDVMRKNGNTNKNPSFTFALFSHFLYINLTPKMVLTFPSQVTECLHHHKSTTKWHSVPYENWQSKIRILYQVQYFSII